MSKKVEKQPSGARFIVKLSPVEIYALLVATVAKLASGLSHPMSIAYVFQHVFITRLKTETNKAELQTASTWERMNTGETQKALEEISKGAVNLGEFFTVKQHVILSLISDKKISVSPEIDALAKYVNSQLHYDKMVVEVKTSKVKSGTATGKGI